MKNVTVTMEHSVADSARIEAARGNTGVSRSVGELLVEDLQHGQNIDGVQIVNPFLTEPAALGLAAP